MENFRTLQSICDLVSQKIRRRQIGPEKKALEIPFIPDAGQYGKSREDGNSKY